jgi:hypothetical protein
MKRFRGDGSSLTRCWAVGDLRKNLWQASTPIPEFRNQAILSSLAATGSVGG